MSNPSGPTPPSGPNSTTPNASGSAPVRRRRPAQDPFMQSRRKQPQKASQSQQPASNIRPSASVNSATQPRQAPSSQTATNGASTAGPVAQSQQDEYDEFPILISKTELMEGMRFHGLKFQVKPGSDGQVPDINPYAAEQFTRPVHLHRRFARDRPDVANAEQSDAPSGVDDKERELWNARKAERQAEREANQALIAPTGSAQKKAPQQQQQQRRKKNQKNVEDVYYDDNDPKQQKAAQLRYEETKPWHLEDFDGKNIWVGSYQAPLSDNGVLFTVDEGGFTMVPVERWYKFIQTNKVAAMDPDQVEKHMSKKVKPPRWFLKTQEANDDARKQAFQFKLEEARARQRGGFDDDRKSAVKVQEYRADVDEMDFDLGDEFQDDDEGMIFGEEAEDAKEIEKRIREEMRGANIFAGVKEEKDWDAEEEREKRETAEERKKQRRLRKQLIKKERKYEYDSESEHPYSESSETEDSEEERERLAEEEKNKEEEARKLAANEDKSGASSKGTNTPSGRTEKRDASRSFTAQGASLKRPGSPNLSDLSGNESSRKKVRGVNGRAISPSSGNGARSLSPDAANRARGKTGYGSGSDTDASRGTKLQRLKTSRHALQSNTNTPSGSAPGSRAQSPAPGRTGTPPLQPLPTLDEIRAAIPAEGIIGGELVKLFKSRVGKERTAAFIGLVKQAGKQDPVTKLIKPKS